MSAARILLADLAAIGATVELVGDQLILRAGPTEIPGTLVHQVRQAKADLLAVLSARPDQLKQLLAGNSWSSSDRRGSFSAPVLRMPSG